MSAVLATDRLETASRTLECLRRQTIRDRLEIVLVSTSGEPLGVAPDELAGFAAYVLVEPEAPLSLPLGRAAGIRAARAPLVFVAETHGFPHPEMAERLVAAIRPPWTAAVPGFCNANPDGAVSWSNLISDYGQWLAALPGGERPTCPPYNTVFQRSFVVEALERDEKRSRPGTTSSQGFAPGVTASSASRPRSSTTSTCRSAGPGCVSASSAGRSQAAVRVRNWSPYRRAAYALGSPLLPFVFLGRSSRPFIAARRAHPLPWLTAPALVAGVVAVAAGELTAFVAGGGPELHEAADEFELHKVAYTTTRDA